MNPFFIEFRGDKRWMRPDLVRFECIEGDFEKMVKIRVEPCETSTKKLANIQIKLLDKAHIKVYEDFIASLNSTMNQRRGDKVRGARIIPKDSSCHEIKSYPLSLFNEQKGFIQSRLEKQSHCLYKVVDWKYIDYITVISNNHKIRGDVIKQLSYELALQSSLPVENANPIESQFVIPFFYSKDYHFSDGNPVGEFVADYNLATCLKDNGIKVFKANFFEIQRGYLSS